jgi:tripartite-type tricarboxylate transporter receptor subunit TctC
MVGSISPARLPKDVLVKLRAAVTRSANTAEMKATFFEQGIELQTTTPERFEQLIRREIERGTTLTKSAGMTPDRKK